MSASGQNLAPTSIDLEAVGMADHRSSLAFDLSDRVCETINSARALFNRQGKFIYIAHFIHSGNSKCFA